jgi:heat-inducible transcriptional repressor
MAEGLNERERTILHYVVRDFIETAIPIGSRYISKRHEDELGLSSASIRNVMSDLEYLGYINHPHTSAGRIPTDQGYRFYLDSLMHMESISESEQEAIRNALHSADQEDTILRESSRLMGKITRQICVITSPKLNTGTLEKIELVPITSTRIMVIISIKLGLIRTMMLDVESEVPRERLDEVARFLNERLAGLTFQELHATLNDRIKDAGVGGDGLVRLFIDSVDKLIPASRSDKIHIGGANDIINQPEFVDPRNFRGVIELISDEEIIIHILEKRESPPPSVKVTVGDENQEERLSPFSVITSSYAVGDVTGTIGLIGPKRMPYSRVIPLIDYVARTISDMFSLSSQP